MAAEIRLPLCKLLFLALCLFTAAACAQGVRVEDILLAGQSADQIDEVMIFSGETPAGRRRAVHRNDSFAAGTEIVAPAATVIVLRSDNGNRIVLEPGSRLRVADVTQAGERYLLRVGNALFEVLKALSFFNVEFDDQFSAQVRGTEFRVIGVPGEGDARFSCEVVKGEVLVRRPERIRIGRRQLAMTQTAVLLTPGGQQKVEWRKADVERIRSFRSIDEAERYVRGRLQQAHAEPLDVTLALGRLAEAAGDRSRALRIYQSAEVGNTPDPRIAELHARKADLLAEARRTDEALRSYDLARQLYDSLYTPNASREVAQVLAREGDLFRQSGQTARAVDKYREAVRVEERAAVVRTNPALRRNLESLEVKPGVPLLQQPRPRIDQR